MTNNLKTNAQKPITKIIKKYLPNHKMKWQVAEETKQMAIWHWQHYLAQSWAGRRYSPFRSRWPSGSEYLLFV